MDALETISLIASIVSVVLGVMAIALSIVFYRMSSQLSENAKESAKDLASSVERLEKLFDKLYSDTFSMMKDTVSDMRKHIWPDETKVDEQINTEAEKKADEKVKKLKDEINKDVLSLLSERERTNEVKIKDLQQIVNKVIVESRKVEVEARKETTRDHIMQILRHYKAMGELSIEAKYLVDKLNNIFPQHIIVGELNRMRDNGIVSWEGLLGPKTKIRLTD